MTNRTIVEAAKQALLLIGHSASVDEVYDVIVTHQLYEFGAKSPHSVIRVTMDRHCANKSLGSMHKQRFFQKNDDGSYELLSDVKEVLQPEQNTSSSEQQRSAQEVENYIEQILDLAAVQREKVKAEILSSLRSFSPEQFESFCRLFLSKYGFTRMELTSRGRDGGIDVRGLLKMGLAEMRVAVQCKRYAEDNKVGRPSVSAFRGDITGDFEQGIFMTTSGFTKEAEEISFKPGCVPIILIDGEQLADIMIDKGIGVQRQLIDVFDFDESLFIN
ncbi:MULTISPECIES: restriction endonuclease [Aeromonas]|uniref:restriction endonuclease n=1 Tax=Aeromonas TaxID=642 RepID=UPI00196220C5|nr:restriction endonuclease [Aeromonas veronii]